MFFDNCHHVIHRLTRFFLFVLLKVLIYVCMRIKFTWSLLSFWIDKYRVFKFFGNGNNIDHCTTGTDSYEKCTLTDSLLDVAVLWCRFAKHDNIVTNPFISTMRAIFITFLRRMPNMKRLGTRFTA